MNINNIIKLSFLGVCSMPVIATAQVGLNDKQAQKVDLGYGMETTEFLTTAATSTITAEELQRTSAISLADALYGKILGLNAFQNTGFKGEEGRGASFNIRGAQTKAGRTDKYSDYNDILILVDGFERPIDRLSVEEVESVTVLKDAAAVALYGHEGVNGVLLVKTKHGTTDGKSHFKAGYSHKFQFDPQMADMVGAYDYASALNIARQNDGQSVAYSASDLQKFQDGTDPLVYPNINWRDEAFGNTASENHAFVSMYGGTENVQYYTQLDYTNAYGLYKGTEQKEWDSQLKYSKANIRANVDFIISKTTRAKVNMFSTFIETNGAPNISSNDAWWHLYKVPALAFPIHTEGGIWGGSQTYGDNNLVAKIQGTGFQKTHQRQIWANMVLEQDLDFITKGLQFYVGGSYDNSSIERETRTKGYQYGWNYYDADGARQETVMGTVVNNKLAFNHWTDAQWRIATFNAGFKYATQFQNGDNFIANANYNIKYEVRDGQSQTWNRMNWNLALHYDHAQKLMADVVLAANGSNRSYPAKWAFSPTVALGWIYANNPEGAITYGKLRASGGIQHTDYVPEAGLWLERWNNGHGSYWYGNEFNSAWGAFLTQFATKDFQQETAYKANLGTDLRLWNALDVTLDGFYQQRTNILVSASQLNSAVVGIQSAYDDKGEVASYGFELGLRYAKAINKDWNIDAAAMISGVKSEVKKWIENPAYPNLSIIGDRADGARGLEAIGFFKDQADIDASPRQEFGRVKPGDIKYKDINGDGVINQNDEIALDYGTSFPALNYAFSLGAEYKGIGINATFQGSANQMKNVRWVDGVWGALSNNRNLSTEYWENCWDKAGDNALYPRLSTEDVANNTPNSTLWYRNAKWLKLRDCEVYYKLPESVVSYIKASGAKVYLQGQNLWSWSSIDTMDAENLNTGYPVMKSLNLGLSLTF